MIIKLTQIIECGCIYSEYSAKELAMDLEYRTRNAIKETLDFVPLKLETDYEVKA